MPSPPANDDLANAQSIFGPSGSTSAVLINDATVEGGELGSLDQTVWYVVQADISTTGVYLSTQGSAAGDAGSGDGITPPNPFGSLDTFIRVWESTTPVPTHGSLFGHNIASNDDAPSGGGAYWSEVTFNITAGKWYFVQVGAAFPPVTGTVILNWSGFPAPTPLTTQLVDHTITKLRVDDNAGGDIPIQMPSGIVAGDHLLAFIMNAGVNPVSIVGPSGWTGALSTGHFWKTADGSEDGAVLHWTTQDTSGTFFPVTRVIVAAVMCYRFSVLPLSEFEFFDSLSGAGSASLSDIPVGGGLVSGTQLRVYCVVGSGENVAFDPTSVHSITAVAWTNAADETGLQTEEWDGTGTVSNDSTGLEVADVFHNYPPPFSVYSPGDAVTITGGAYSTGGQLYTHQYNFPGFVDVVHPYWGILATPG